MGSRRVLVVAICLGPLACADGLVPGTTEQDLAEDPQRGLDSDTGDESGWADDETGVEPLDEGPADDPPADDLPPTSFAQGPIQPLIPVEQRDLAGASLEPPAVQLRDEDDQPIVGAQVVFEARGEGSKVGPFEVTTDEHGVAQADRWQLGKLVGRYEVVAWTPELELPALTFVGIAESDFDIELVYVNPVTDAQALAFERAKARWEGIVLSDHERVEGDLAEYAQMCGTEVEGEVSGADLTIFVDLLPIDGRYGVLGQAGPCVLRGSDRTPAFGRMVFDTADLEALEQGGLLNDVILHEMGHVIGVGTLWDNADLVASPSLPDQAGADTHFVGEQAHAAFDEVLGGIEYTGGATVPVENDGNPGSADGHWRESVFKNELMTPTIRGNEGSRPLSALTIASLVDLGSYDVNLGVADGYQVPFGLQASAAGPPATDDVVLGRCGEPFRPHGWVLERR